MRILEQNAIQNFNFDGVVNNWLATQYQDGVVKNIANALPITFTTNSITLGTGYVYVHGIRIVLDTQESFTLVTLPEVAESRQIVLKVTLAIISGSNLTITGEFINRATVALTQDDILTDKSGTYELEICRYNVDADGIIDVARTINYITIAEEDFAQLRAEFEIVEDNVNDALAQSTAALESANEALAGVTPYINHTTRTDNPHAVTANQIGLGNVNNTSDADKPVSTLQATAINNVIKTFADTIAITQGVAETLTTGKYYADGYLQKVPFTIDTPIASLGTNAILTGYISGTASGYHEYYDFSGLKLSSRGTYQLSNSAICEILVEIIYTFGVGYDIINIYFKRAIFSDSATSYDLSLRGFEI